MSNKQSTHKTSIQGHVDSYPVPPFKQQKQPFPGLVSEMSPLPDHGEKTYQGSGKLTGRKALITGGDSAANGRLMT